MKFRKKYYSSLRNKYCILTGASSGIGKLLAYELARYGTNLILVARREALLLEVMDECKKIAKEQELDIFVYYCVADLGNSEGVQTLKSCCIANNISVDILIANAGASMHAKISESTESLYYKMLQANYFSLVNVTIAFLGDLKKNKGVLVGVTSIQSLIGVPYHGAYVAAKHAAGGFLETLELEEPDINIVEILPGWVSGTDIRKSALDGAGNILEGRDEHKRHSRSSITSEECVDSILEGIHKRQRLVYRPNFWRNILFVKYSMRKYLHFLIKGRQKFSSGN